MPAPHPKMSKSELGKFTAIEKHTFDHEFGLSITQQSCIIPPLLAQSLHFT